MLKQCLRAGKKDNDTTKWPEGLRFIQWQKNTRFHSGIGRTPYEAMFGQKPHLGIATSSLPGEMEEGLEMEVQLSEALAAGMEEDATTHKSPISSCQNCEEASSAGDLCYLCDRKEAIQAERKGAMRKQQNLADKNEFGFY